MNLLGVFLLSAAVAGPVRAHLDHVAALPVATVAEAPLRAFDMVSDQVPEVAALGPAFRAGRVPADAPAVQGLAVSDLGQNAKTGEFGPVGSLGGLPGMVVVSAFDALGGAASAEGAVVGFTGLAGAAAPVVWKPVVFMAQGPVVAEVVDPLLSPIDVWVDGALGDLKRQATEAAGRGDRGAFDRFAARYWEALRNATERRRAFGERGRDGGAPDPGVGMGR